MYKNFIFTTPLGSTFGKIFFMKKGRKTTNFEQPLIYEMKINCKDLHT